MWVIGITIMTAIYWACNYAYHAGYAYHQAGGVL